MNEISTFLESNLLFIYFVYGLAHFVMGLAVALETGRTSQLQLSRALPLLAVFGITHGINEWAEMFMLIAAQTSPGGIVPWWAPMFRLAWKALSFFFLFGFGAQLLQQLVPEQKRWLRVLPALAILIYLGGVFAMFLRALPQTPPRDVVSLWSNYALGIPAALITIGALLAQRRAFLRENLPQFGRDFVGAALAIAWYCLLDQMIDEPSTFFPANILNTDTFLHVVGVPVEIPRTLAVSALAFFIIRAMRVFEVEYTRRLDAANRARFLAQEDAKRELTVMFETCRLLGTSLDIDRLADDFLNQIVTLLEPVIGATVYLPDLVQGRLCVRHRRVRAGYELSLPQKECSTHAAQRAFETGQIAYEAEAHSKISFVSIPLFAQDKIIGVLCLAHQNAFSNYTVIQTLARQLGIALENARLYREVQEKEKLRGQLLERAVAAQEEERKRIARELHDETGQLLTALAVGLGGVEQTLTQDPVRARDQIAELKNMTMHAIDGLRQFVADLRPAVLDDMGLVAALRWFAERYAERTGLRIEFHVSGAKHRLAAQVETVLFRIAQEGLNNVGRHARATHARVQLEFTDALIRLIVEDDGCGFVVAHVLGAQPHRRAWGLLGIQERIELVGGRFKVESAPGRGTRLLVEVPLTEDRAAMPPPHSAPQPGESLPA